MKIIGRNIFKQVKCVENFCRFCTKLSVPVDTDSKHDNKLKGIEDKILFSSYLEKQKLKLGYKRNQILRNIAEKYEKRAKLENIEVKPFPSALKYVENIDSIEDEAKYVSEKETSIENSGVSISHGSLDSFEANVGRDQLLNSPRSWMQDYEYFDENEEIVSKQGTPDPTIPPSEVPCSGCGAQLHCVDPGLPGYIPSEIFKDRKTNELKTIVCQRCHFLKEYNIAVDITVPAEKYVEIVSSIKDKYALAILIVDLLDVPISIWPGIQDILGTKRPIFVVGNKVDLLPKDSRGYLDHIKKCLIESVLKVGLDKMNIKHVALISAKTGYGVEELITQLHNIWKYKGDVYLVGCTNVGKSSLFNALLRSDYCKVQAVDLVQKATACPLPGTTLNMLKFPILRPSDIRIYERCQRLLSEREQKAAEAKLRRDQLRKTGKVEHATLMGHIGCTFSNKNDSADQFAMPRGAKPILALNEKSKDFVNSKWCYDTPGVIQPEQIHNLLTIEELLHVIPTQMISPRVFKVDPGMTIFLGGLGRLDFLSGDVESMRLTTYSAHSIPILITRTENADEIYSEALGTEFLKVPCGDEERMRRWPGLCSSAIIEITGELDNAATCDILLSSVGWIAIKLPLGKTCQFKAWTPHGRGIVTRKPSLIPHGENLRGSKIRRSLAYRIGKPFIKQ